LHLNEAELIVSLYERLYQNLDAPTIAKLDWRGKLTLEESELVGTMEKNLQAAMDKFLNKGVKSVFVKTSSRSPKDAPMAQARFKDLYQKFLRRAGSF
jgi:hypothetical protein